MISRAHSTILQGIDAVACEVEAHVVSGPSDKPEVKLVGLEQSFGVGVLGLASRDLGL